MTEQTIKEPNIRSKVLKKGARLVEHLLVLVRALVVAPPPVSAVLRSFTETQNAKYVPGNVTHFVWRHFYLKDYGVEHRPIVTATLLEIAGLPVAAIWGETDSHRCCISFWQSTRKSRST